MKSQEEIDTISQKIQSIMKEERDDAPKIKKVADYCGKFSVLDEGSIDESFSIELDGQRYYDEDSEGTSVCDEFFGTGRKEVLDSVALSLHRYVDNFEDVSLPELTEEQAANLKREASKQVALARAALLMEINAAINQTLYDRIEARLHELEKTITNFEYKGWEEVELDFLIDGERYTTMCWDGELTHCPRRKIE